MSGNFVLVYRPDTNTWWPWNSANTHLGGMSGGAYEASYNFDFYDGNMNFVNLNGTANVGLQTINYYTLGYWDSVNNTTYYTSPSNNPFAGTGPNYAGNWDSPIANAYFYDSNTLNWMYRYVYLNGSGGFYTADNGNNPPY
jgi:hypothetical protein